MTREAVRRSLAAWPFPVGAALDEVWTRVPSSRALYVRGSVARGPGGHVPWDLDVVVISETEDAGKGARDVGNAVERLWPTVPPLDLRVSTWEGLTEECSVLTRILLAVDGACVRGGPPGALEIPALNAALGARIRPTVTGTALAKAQALRARIAEGAPSDEIAGRCKSLAKAALRTASAPALGELGTLLRSPDDCTEWIGVRLPTLRPELRVLCAHLGTACRPRALATAADVVATAVNDLMPRG